MNVKRDSEKRAKIDPLTEKINRLFDKNTMKLVDEVNIRKLQAQKVIKFIENNNKKRGRDKSDPSEEENVDEETRTKRETKIESKEANALESASTEKKAKKKIKHE